MYKKIMTIIIAITILLTMVGCGQSKSNDETNNSKPTEQNGQQSENNEQNENGESTDGNQQGDDSGETETSPSQQDTDEIKDKISTMTIEEKLGQMVLAGVEGDVKDKYSEELIEKYKIGGFILLGQNIKSTDQVVKLLNSLKETNKSQGNDIPLFLGVDQEGGRVDRMPKEFLRMPTNRKIGNINSEDYSYSIGKVLATEAKAFGYNIDFAPVLDINSNPKNPVIGDRSFGTDYDKVSRLGIRTMEGIRDVGIIPSVKHFPGHGDTSVDSHTGLPVVNVDIDRLKSFETVPFKNAIDQGADMVMVAHILFPRIDKDNPASLSKTIISDLLRRDLNYDGVVITDDMTMGAILKNYEIGEAAVKSVKAGSDIILVCHDYNNIFTVINALQAAVKNGDISEEDVDKSVYRILKLKEKYKIQDDSVYKVDVNAINSMIKETLKMPKSH